jgi:Peptidase family M28
MIHSNGARLLIITPLLCALAFGAKTPYLLLGEGTIQQRLDLYKGNDSTREAALFKLFAEAGCQTANLSEQPVPHRKQPNIICVLPGTTPAVIVVGAHFDHVSEGEGIIDNWSGASLLPSLFQSIAGSPRKHTFIFVAFTGEEEGLLGSAYYVKSLAKDQLSKVEAMINLDTLGLGPTEVWVSQSAPWLVNGLVVVARSMNLPITGMDVTGIGKSDEESFIGEKVCTITIHSLTPQTLHMLHHAADNPGALHFQDYYQTYRLLATYLAVIDAATAPAGNSCQIKPL